VRAGAFPCARWMPVQRHVHTSAQLLLERTFPKRVAIARARADAQRRSKARVPLRAVEAEANALAQHGHDRARGYARVVTLTCDVGAKRRTGDCALSAPTRRASTNADPLRPQASAARGVSDQNVADLAKVCGPRTANARVVLRRALACAACAASKHKRAEWIRHVHLARREPLRR